MPEESRFNGEPARKEHVMSWYFGGDKKEKNIQILQKLGEFSKDLGYS